LYCSLRDSHGEDEDDVDDDSDEHVKMHLRCLHWASLSNCRQDDLLLRTVTSLPIRIAVESLNDTRRLDRGIDDDGDGGEEDAAIDRRVTRLVVQFYILILTRT
jgi:hypothetical protein